MNQFAVTQSDTAMGNIEEIHPRPTPACTYSETLEVSDFPVREGEVREEEIENVKQLL